MTNEWKSFGEHALECKCIFLLDPETIEGDYAEAYQRWEHHFNKAREKVQDWKSFAETPKII